MREGQGERGTEIVDRRHRERKPEKMLTGDGMKF